MRRQSYVNTHWYQRPDAPYARTSGWATRYYNRKTGDAVVTALSGLNVTDDDFSKRKGESPKIENARLNGSKETRKRAQSMSRMGQRFNGMPPGSEETHTNPVGDEWIPVKEFRSVKFQVKSSGRLTSIGLYLRTKTEVKNTNAYFLAIVRTKGSRKEICRAIKPVKGIKKEAELTWFRLIRTLEGDFELELTLVDDMNNTGAPLDTVVEVSATGESNHEWAEHKVPNIDEALREIPYKYNLGINNAVVCTKTTTWKPWNAWIQNGYFVSGDTRYIIIPVINGEGKREIYKQPYVRFRKDGSFEILRNQPITLFIPTNKINQYSMQVRMTQAGGAVYFVDGFSHLQKVDLENWGITEAKPTNVDMFSFVPNNLYYKNSLIWHNNQFWRAKADFRSGATFDPNQWTPEGSDSLTAWPGASLIYFLNNRLFLSGFREASVGIPKKPEPNLVLVSSIDSVAPRYDMFNRQIEFFYVPDRSPTSTGSAPITAFSSYSDSLIIFTADGFVYEQVAANVEFGGISQTTPEGSNYGCLKQEHVVKGRNNIYFVNPSLGVMRLGGSVANTVSRPVDSILKRINDNQLDKAYLSMHGDMLRFYHTTDSDKNDACLIDYTQYSRQKSYWYYDTNTPVKMMYSDDSYDIELGIGSEYPCVIEAENTLRDFDCAIEYVYYTEYLNTPNALDGMIVRRVHVTTLQDFHSSIYVGLDYNHNNKPIVWRRFVTAAERGDYMPEDVFSDDEEVGATTISLRVLTTDSEFCQIRIKQYCYDYQAEILRLSLEYGNRTNL